MAEVLVIWHCSAWFGHALPGTNESLALDLGSFSGKRQTVFSVSADYNMFM